MLNKSEKKINATKFLEQLKLSLKDYKQELETSSWTDEIWKSARTKLKAIIKSIN
jgi:lipoate-protein ligase A